MIAVTMGLHALWPKYSRVLHWLSIHLVGVGACGCSVTDLIMRRARKLVQETQQKVYQYYQPHVDGARGSSAK
jgi:hypothetical protein